jgi:hypothetical protein
MAASLNRRIAAGVVGIALLTATGCRCHQRRQPSCPAPCPTAGGCCPEPGGLIGGPSAAPVGVPPITPVPGGPPPATAFSMSPSPGCCGGATLP